MNEFIVGTSVDIPEPSIIFYGGSTSKEVMRLNKDGVTVNPEMHLDEAAQHVIKVLDAQIQHLVRCEREACAEVIDKHLKNWASLAGKDKAYKWLEKIAVTIRARGNT